MSFSSIFIDWLQWMTEPALDHRLKSANQALQALEKEETRKKAFLVSTKPADSQVILNKRHNFLEIYIPPRGFTLELLPTIGFAAVWNGFLVNWYLMALRSGNSMNTIEWFAVFFPLVHVGVGIWFTLRILFALFGQVWLQINSEKITLKYRLFGLNYQRPRPASRHNIIKLERTKISYKSSSEGSKTEVKPQINIWAGTKKFTIGGEGLLSEIELDWLVGELSDWLDLPIIREA